jgi:hypothetical protein
VITGFFCVLFITMGQCQSAFLSEHISQSAPRKTKERNLRPSNKSTSIDNKQQQSKRVHIGIPNKTSSGPTSPSEETTSTTLETPSPAIISKVDDLNSVHSSTSMLSLIASLTKSLSQQSLKEEDEEEDDSERRLEEIDPMKQLNFESTPALKQMIQLGTDFDEEFDDDIIPEEADPDAPSDEEESLQRGSHAVDEWELEPGPLIIPNKNISSRRKSPPRPQSYIKLKNAKITKPSSIVHRKPPALSAKSSKRPSPGSVDPHTLAQFNKLKVQVKLMKHQEKINRRASKFEDRYDDVRTYRNLHKEFENIQSHVRKTQPTRLKRSRSFDLKDAKCWFFDFHTLDDDDVDDEKSVGSMSLLSAASMEAQRQFFEAKFQARRRNSEPAASSAPFVHSPYIPTKSNALIGNLSQGSGIPMKEQKSNEINHVSSSPSSSPRKIKQLMSTSIAILRQIKKTEQIKKYDPLQEVCSQSVAITPVTTTVHVTPKRKTSAPNQDSDVAITPTLPWPLQADSIDNDYHLQNNICDERNDDHTPTTGSCRRLYSDGIAEYARNSGYAADSLELNDYHVPRRRRQPTNMKVDSRALDASLAIPRPASPTGSVTSIGSSVSGLSYPGTSMGITDVSEPSWRAFSIEDPVIAKSTKNVAGSNDVFNGVKLLAGLVPEPKGMHSSSNVTDMAKFDLSQSEGKEENIIKNDEVLPKVCIATMSKEDFLSIAEEHSLARFSRDDEAEITLEARRLDFESELIHPSLGGGNVAIGRKDQKVADLVSQEVRALLSRFRHET